MSDIFKRFTKNLKSRGSNFVEIDVSFYEADLVFELRRLIDETYKKESLGGKRRVKNPFLSCICMGESQLDNFDDSYLRGKRVDLEYSTVMLKEGNLVDQKVYIEVKLDRDQIVVDVPDINLQVMRESKRESVQRFKDDLCKLMHIKKHDQDSRCYLVVGSLENVRDRNIDTVKRLNSAICELRDVDFIDEKYSFRYLDTEVNKSLFSLHCYRSEMAEEYHDAPYSYNCFVIEVDYSD